MSDYNLNTSTAKIAKLEEALKKFSSKDLDPKNFEGNAESIFDTINNAYDNIYTDTGLKEILISIAGDDGEISAEDFKALVNADGKDSFTTNDFLAYANNALDRAINEFNLDSKKETEINNYNTGDVRTKVIQNKTDGKIDSLSEIRSDGSKYQYTYDDEGKKSQSVMIGKDKTKAVTEFVYDKNGNKIGAKTTRYDALGNIQTITEAKYDEQGRQTYGKTTDANGNIQGEGNYKYQQNADGTFSQLRYNMLGELTHTLVYKDDIKTPISRTDHLSNNTETFSHNSDGTTSSVVKSANGKTAEEITYNKDGEIKTKVLYNDYGEKIAEITYTYFDNGAIKDTNIVHFASVHGTDAMAQYKNDVSGVIDSTSQTTGRTKVTPQGKKLAQVGEEVAIRRNTNGYCLGGVNEAIKKIYGYNFPYNSAYQALDGIRQRSDFKEITSEYPNSSDLKNLPEGAIVIWDRGPGANKQHGHISIAIGNGMEASDRIRNQITMYGTTYHVFYPTR